ncbi:hypothetical protein [Qipengyuania vesicularis]|uniref:hypothetical protein n=1 Tax=Qipengyuania vesicularis TaxID=2867232 RepID=UPI001C879B79|nr:hypothetical protein [Qipengyuania vesicularis]MBX7527832.1 hypothetical protein [Qipengyuania vesicularis]
MRVFAVLCGVFVGGVLCVIGYAMAYLHETQGYLAPVVLAIAGVVGLPILYWMKASRLLPQLPSRFLFAAMIIALAGTWWPLLQSAELREEQGAALLFFSAIWIVAALPLLRAGIRHRPR